MDIRRTTNVIINKNALPVLCNHTKSHTSRKKFRKKCDFLLSFGYLLYEGIFYGLYKCKFFNTFDKIILDKPRTFVI